MIKLRAWWIGFVECGTDMGLTWDNPDHPLSRAYDYGRSFGRWLRRMD